MSSLPSVVAFSGKALSGKSTCAKALAKILYDAGYWPRIRSFADPIRKAVITKHGYASVEEMKEKDLELYRSECQLIGATKRAEDHDYWVKIWAAQVRDGLLHDSEGRVVYIAEDCRYPNEVQAIQEMGGLVIHVHRTNLPDPTGEFRQHESEAMANSIDRQYLDRQPVLCFGNMTKIMHGISNNGDVDRVEKRLQDFLGVWEYPGDILLSPNNPFIHAFNMDYRVPQRLMQRSFVDECIASGFARGTVDRYTYKNARNMNEDCD